MRLIFDVGFGCLKLFSRTSRLSLLEVFNHLREFLVVRDGLVFFDE